MLTYFVIFTVPNNKKLIKKNEMSNLMNTNTNHYKERVRNYIINNINPIESNNTDKKKQIHNAEVLTEKETQVICDNFYNHIALHVIKYAEKLEIKLTNLY